jgi:DNA end-binding protein Ku
MPPHSLGTGTISFGLVSIPVRLYAAAVSGNVSFNLLHAKCGSRIRQQVFCPVCQETVERADLVRGYEFSKDQYVRVADEELKALEGETSRVIDIAEFVPLAQVDPVYFEKTYYLGPDKGGDKAYRLLAETMADADRVALARFIMRGKESLVLVRAAQSGLMLHTMYFADEVRSFGEIDKGGAVKIQERELELAKKLVAELSTEAFRPDQYQDEYRQRVLELLNRKVEGQEVAAATPEAPRSQVIDLMEALRQSLAKRAGGGEAAPEEAAPRKPPTKAAPPAAARRAAEPAPARRAQAGKK